MLLAVVLLSLSACASSPPLAGAVDVIEVGMPWGDVAAVLHKHQFVLSMSCLSNSRTLFGWPPNYCTHLRGDRLLVINADEDASVVESISIVANISKPKDYHRNMVSLKRFDPAADPYEQPPESELFRGSDSNDEDPATASPLGK
jgi:hypothetical protein